jgi:DNA-binding beta-propeller fold protein YncE
MRKLIIVAVCVLAGVALGAADVYHPLREIAIGGDGGWDYLIVDSSAHRLYVSHATKIVVADADSGKIVGEITDLPGVHGIAIAPELGRGFTSNGRANTSTIVDLKTLMPIARVATGANPDSIRYSPSHKEVWTFNHTGKSVTVFGAQDGKVLATITLSGELEEAVEDPAASRMYVNIEDSSEVVVVDTKSLKVVGRWSLAPGEEPTGLALDDANHLFACARMRMTVVDSQSARS